MESSGVMPDSPEPVGGKVSPAVRILFWIIFCLASLLGLFLALTLLDRWYAAGRHEEWAYGSHGEDPIVISYVAYPYTGHHAQEHFFASGPAGAKHSWLYYKNYDFRTGDFGFTSIDFDFRKPPPKEPGEYRIVWLGGSAAWGEGARANDDMHYRQLEHILREKLAADGIKVRVICMAMSGSTTYQNFIAMNYWAHPIQPDMVISFSGRNDFFVPISEERGSSLPHKFENVLGLTEAAQHYNSPDWLKTLARWFPGLLLGTNLGTALRVLQLDRYKELAFRRAQKNLELYYPQMHYIHALASIKRDFDGIPIILVSQPIMPPDHPENRVYRQFIREVFAEIQRMPADQGWYLLDLSKEILEDPKINANLRKYFADPVHLSSAGQRYVAERLAREVAPIVSSLAAGG